MATPGLVDRTSCSICMEQYCSNKHVPKILPCTHTFCLCCLTSMSTMEGVSSCPVCQKQSATPPHNLVTNRIVLEIVEEMQKVPQLNKNVIWWISLCGKLLLYAQSVGKLSVILGGKLLQCALVFVLFKLVYENIGEHKFTRDRCFTMMSLSFLLSCCQFFCCSSSKEWNISNYVYEQYQTCFESLSG